MRASSAGFGIVEQLQTLFEAVRFVRCHLRHWFNIVSNAMLFTLGLGTVVLFDTALVRLLQPGLVFAWLLWLDVVECRRIVGCRIFRRLGVQIEHAFLVGMGWRAGPRPVRGATPRQGRRVGTARHRDVLVVDVIPTDSAMKQNNSLSCFVGWNLGVDIVIFRVGENNTLADGFYSTVCWTHFVNIDCLVD